MRIFFLYFTRPLHKFSNGPSLNAKAPLNGAFMESIFLSRVAGRGFHVEGEGTMSRVEGNIFFSKKVIIDAINVIKTNKKNLKNKWRENIF